jgi:phage gpG-like protein
MIEMNINKDDLAKVLRKMNALSVKDRSGKIFQAFQDSGALLANRLGRAAGGKILKSRTGDLRKSIGSKVVQNGEDISATVGSGTLTGGRMKYASIHEHGGVIRPKNGRFIAIPLQAARTPAGVARGTPRSYQNTFIAKRVIWQRIGKNIIPLFALKRSVTIPATHYMSRTMESNKEPIIKTFIRSINEAMKTE